MIPATDFTPLARDPRYRINPDGDAIGPRGHLLVGHALPDGYQRVSIGSASDPLRTMLTRDAYGIVVAAAGNTYDAATRDQDGYIRAWPADGSPVPAQTTTGQLGIITTLRRNSTPTAADVDPLAAIAAGGRHHGLVIPYRKGAKPHPPTEPVSAQATRSQHGVMRPAVDINDCHFRMLTPREAANAQAFPRDYIIHGNSGEQQMQAGNAVAVNVAAWLGAAATRSLDERTAS